ncbi:hypothetical protein FVE85_8966 [Porphyridium purpureum]|uniref:Fe2OG dioxygenase domain-containing protein n=1 Tax=Porphyridium purpureum TaxID=35688 RepID=A0A5J4YHV7_PORPP|nr:hypothetical protein FVE85_8966 [Porphyridium purpureum]|eukprot:POR7675..scf226_27
MSPFVRPRTERTTSLPQGRLTPVQAGDSQQTIKISLECGGRTTRGNESRALASRMTFVALGAPFIRLVGQGAAYLCGSKLNPGLRVNLLRARTIPRKPVLCRHSVGVVLPGTSSNSARLVKHWLPKELCAQLVYLAETAGAYSRDEELLDGAELYQHDVYADNGQLQLEGGGTEINRLLGTASTELRTLLFPQMHDRVRALVNQAWISKSGDRLSCSEDELAHLARLRISFCFLRKYSPDTRPGLVLHSDESYMSVIVALNAPDEYAGGEFGIADSTVSALLGIEEPYGGYQSHAIGQSTLETCVRNANRVGDIEYRARVERVKLDVGSALLHPGSLFHFVDPVTSGTRYSLILFLDTDEKVEQTGEHYASDDGSSRTLPDRLGA